MSDSDLSLSPSNAKVGGSEGAKDNVIPKKVIRISFRKAAHSRERNYNYLKYGNPVLQVEVLGTHTFEDVGEVLFRGYLGAVLGETLNDHVWLFSPNLGDEELEEMMFSASTPLLSPQFGLFNQLDHYSSGARKIGTRFPITEGLEMLFTYDLGSTTVLAATVDSIAPIPEDIPESAFPRIYLSESAQEIERRRAAFETQAPLTIRMDEAYPRLRERIFGQDKISFSYGKGSSPYGNRCNSGNWGYCWGGGCNPAFTGSIQLNKRFDDMDEFWECLNQGIAKQEDPGHPYKQVMVTLRNEKTEEVFRTEEDPDLFKDFEVHLHAYPCSTPPSTYAAEFTVDPDIFYMGEFREKDASRDPNLKKIRSESRWGFSFALSPDWRANKTHSFSFTKQFPKCSKWTSYDPNKNHWFRIAGNRLYAYKRVNGREEPDPAFSTSTYSSLHAMFTEMESNIVLPAAWSKKRKANAI